MEKVVDTGALVREIQSGKSVHVGGRSAHNIAELNFALVAIGVQPVADDTPERAVTDKTKSVTVTEAQFEAAVAELVAEKLEEAIDEETEALNNELVKSGELTKQAIAERDALQVKLDAANEEIAKLKAAAPAPAAPAGGAPGAAIAPAAGEQPALLDGGGAAGKGAK